MRPHIDQHELTIVAIVLEIGLPANEDDPGAVRGDLRLADRDNVARIGEIERARG
jgi:hypothetical protein